MTTMKNTTTNRPHVINKIIAAVRRKQSMEKVIELLRSLEFYFVTPDDLHIGIKPPFKSKPQKYGWMIHRIRKGQYAVNSLQFGIKMWGKKNDKIVVVYEHGYIETLHIPWKDKSDINFRKTYNTLKFPEYLNYEERRKWRTEHHKQLKNPNRIPSEYYLKILPDVYFIPKGTQEPIAITTYYANLLPVRKGKTHGKA